MGMNAALPAPGQDAAAAPLPPRRHDAVGRFWDILLAIDIIAIALLFGSSVVAILMGADVTGGGLTRAALWQQAAIGIVAFGVIPAAWAWGTRGRGAIRFLGLDRPWPNVAYGLVGLLALFLAVIVIGLTLQAFGFLEENPQLDAITGIVTIPLAIALAISAGVGEEIFFRGVLQKWVGLWGQAALFGIAHAGFGTILQVVLPVALGFAFGYWVHKTKDLWAPIVAHTLYDLVVLTAA